MREPLGMDKETWLKRNKRVRKYWEKFPQWVKGYHAGKKGEKRTENPYKLDNDILKLLRKRTYWDMGWEEAAFASSSKKLAKIAKTKAKELERIEKEFKRKKKHKHGHHKKHRSKH